MSEGEINFSPHRFFFSKCERENENHFDRNFPYDFFFVYRWVEHVYKMRRKKNSRLFIFIFFKDFSFWKLALFELRNCKYNRDSHIVVIRVNLSDFKNWLLSMSEWWSWKVFLFFSFLKKLLELLSLHDFSHSIRYIFWNFKCLMNELKIVFSVMMRSFSYHHQHKNLSTNSWKVKLFSLF